MTSRDFCFWLQGYLEVTSTGGEPPALTAAQTACVQNHLALVFTHEIDPSMGDAKHQQALDAVHPGTSATAPWKPRPPGVRC